MKPRLFVRIAISVLVTTMTACSMQVKTADLVALAQSTNTASAQKTYNDPFEYCAAVGTIDKPDARYTGPQISDEIINGFLSAAGIKGSTEPMEMLKKTTMWRCMNQRLYACNFGANLPCDSKANTEKTPSPEMEDYCKANQGSDFIPMSVTGHDTIYNWHCVKDKAERLSQISEVDAAGFLAQIWFPITPSSNVKPETNP